MSRVAHEFWNHKRIAQAEARARLKALGILTGDDANVTEAVQATRHLAANMAKAVLSYKSPLMDLILKKGRAVGPSTYGQMYKDSAK